MSAQPNHDPCSIQDVSDPWAEPIFIKRPSTTIIYRKTKKARKLKWRELQKLKEGEIDSSKVKNTSKTNSELILKHLFPSTKPKRKRPASEYSNNNIPTENVTDSNSQHPEIQFNSRSNKRKKRNRNKKASQNAQGSNDSQTELVAYSNDFSYELPSLSNNFSAGCGEAVVSLKDFVPGELSLSELHFVSPDFLQVPTCLKRLQLLIYIIIVNCFSKFSLDSAKDETLLLFDSLIANLTNLKKLLHSSGPEFLLNGSKPNNTLSSEYYDQIVSHVNDAFILHEEIVPFVTDLSILSVIIRDIQNLRDAYFSQASLILQTFKPTSNTNLTSSPGSSRIAPDTTIPQAEESKIMPSSRLSIQNTNRPIKSSIRSARKRVFSSDDEDDSSDDSSSLAKDFNLYISSLILNQDSNGLTELHFKSPQKLANDSFNEDEINLSDISIIQANTSNINMSFSISSQVPANSIEKRGKKPRKYVFSSDEEDFLYDALSHRADDFNLIFSDHGLNNPADLLTKSPQLLVISSDNEDVNVLLEDLSSQADASNLSIMTLTSNNLTEPLIENSQAHFLSSDTKDKDASFEISSLKANDYIPSTTSLVSDNPVKPLIENSQVHVLSSDGEDKNVLFESLSFQANNPIPSTIFLMSDSPTKPLDENSQANEIGSDNEDKDSIFDSFSYRTGDSNLSMCSLFSDLAELPTISPQEHVLSSDNED